MGLRLTLRGGEYEMTETVALTEEDSGTAASPIVYRVESKDAAVLYGGKRLNGFCGGGGGGCACSFAGGNRVGRCISAICEHWGLRILGS